MKQVKKWLETVMFNHYIETGKVLSFLQIQDILISKGFSYYINPRDGKKKLKIRRLIYPYYDSVKRRLKKKKEKRDIALKLLTGAIEYGDKEIYRKVYKQLKEYLTNRDIEELRRLSKEKEIREKEVLKL